MELTKVFEGGTTHAVYELPSGRYLLVTPCDERFFRDLRNAKYEAARGAAEWLELHEA